jgi:hypothetical protein
MLSKISAWLSTVIGALFLVAALVLYIAHGVLLMGYEDSGYGEWDWTRANVWLASIPMRFRIAFWMTSVGAPALLFAGAAFLVLGVYRASRTGGVARGVNSTSAEDV